MKSNQLEASGENVLENRKPRFTENSERERERIDLAAVL